MSFLAILCLSSFVFAADTPSGAEILQAAGTSRGLIVHLGCGDGRLTGDLYAGEDCIVHGLDADPHNIQEARDYLRRLGVYGPVSVERWQGQRLPYADNLVNVIVAGDKWQVASKEIARVLAAGLTLAIL